MTKSPHSAAHAPRGERFADEPTDDPSASVDASEPDSEEKTSKGLRRQTGVTSLQEIAALPIVEHPLRLFLLARRVPVSVAARVIGVERRQLTRWFAWNSRPTPGRAAEVARLLGFGGDVDDDLKLFPRLTDNGATDDDT